MWKIYILLLLSLTVVIVYFQTQNIIVESFKNIYPERPKDTKNTGNKDRTCGKMKYYKFKNPTLTEKLINDARINMNMSPLYYAAYNQENPSPWQTWELNVENPEKPEGVTWHANPNTGPSERDSSWGFGANGDWIINSIDPKGTVYIQPHSGKTTIGKSSPSKTLSIETGITVEDNNIQTYNTKDSNNRFVLGELDKNQSSIYTDRNGLNIYHPQKNTNFLTDTTSDALHADESVQSNTASFNDKNKNILEFQSKNNSFFNKNNNISNQQDALYLDTDVVTINDTLNVNSKLCINDTCITPDLLSIVIRKMGCSNAVPTFLYVGASKTQQKIIFSKLPSFYKLPRYPMPYNVQKSTWGDRFTATRRKDGAFVITRIDRKEGWGQPLIFKVSPYC